MTKSGPQPRYEVITQEDDNGDLIIPLPLPLLKRLGWKDGDDVTIDVDSDGKIYLRKTDK
jgi:bifunctional DNA-binding transcriptional regulator/antitoxin component of YhaV-PrlF toxin-antitoxin module